MNYHESTNLPPMTQMTRRNMLGVMGGVVSGLSLLGGVAQGQTAPAGAATDGGNAKENNSGQVHSHGQGFRIQPCFKWVKVYFGDEVVANSRRTLMVFDNRSPVYYFPERDVRMELLTPTTHSTHSRNIGEASYYN